MLNAETPESTMQSSLSYAPRHHAVARKLTNSQQHWQSMLIYPAGSPPWSFVLCLMPVFTGCQLCYCPLCWMLSSPSIGFNVEHLFPEPIIC